MILTTRRRGVKFPHLCHPCLIRKPDFILTEETSGSSSKLHDPRFYQPLTHLSRCSDIESAAPCARLRAEVTMSKVFTIFNLLTFDGVKYMENGDLCRGAWTDCIYKKYRLRRGRALPSVPGPCARQRGADGYEW